MLDSGDTEALTAVRFLRGNLELAQKLGVLLGAHLFCEAVERDQLPARAFWQRGGLVNDELAVFASHFHGWLHGGTLRVSKPHLSER